MVVDGEYLLAGVGEGGSVSDGCGLNPPGGGSVMGDGATAADVFWGACEGGGLVLLDVGGAWMLQQQLEEGK